MRRDIIYYAFLEIKQWLHKQVSNQAVDLPAVAVTKGSAPKRPSSLARDIMRFTLHHWGVQIASHSLISEQAKFDLGANIYRNAAATAFRLVCRITIGMPFPPQNVYWNGIPVRSGTTTPLLLLLLLLISSFHTIWTGQLCRNSIVDEFYLQDIKLMLYRCEGPYDRSIFSSLYLGRLGIGFLWVWDESRPLVKCNGSDHCSKLAMHKEQRTDRHTHTHLTFDF